MEKISIFRSIGSSEVVEEEEQEEGRSQSKRFSRTMHIVFAHIIYFSLCSFHLRINLF